MLLELFHRPDVALHRGNQAGLQEVFGLGIGGGQRREVRLAHGDVLLAALAHRAQKVLALLRVDALFQHLLQHVDAVGGLRNQGFEMGIHLGVVARLGHGHHTVDVEPRVAHPFVGQRRTLIHRFQIRLGIAGCVQAAEGHAGEGAQQQQHRTKSQGQALGDFEVVETHGYFSWVAENTFRSFPSRLRPRQKHSPRQAGDLRGVTAAQDA
ncbi:hypothetical protein D9M68_732670 [compost metagenome]